MRKFLIVLVIVSSLILSGCALINEVNHSLEYVNKATEHINTWNTFGQKAPQLIQDAVTNTDAKAELEEELNTLLLEIDEFNQTEPPAIAESVHQQIVNKNESLKAVIENALANGELALDQLENSDLFKLIDDVASLMNVVENLEL